MSGTKSSITGIPFPPRSGLRFLENPSPDNIRIGPRLITATVFVGLKTGIPQYAAHILMAEVGATTVASLLAAGAGTEVDPEWRHSIAVASAYLATQGQSPGMLDSLVIPPAYRRWSMDFLSSRCPFMSDGEYHPDGPYTIAVESYGEFERHTIRWKGCPPQHLMLPDGLSVVLVERSKSNTLTPWLARIHEMIKVVGNLGGGCVTVTEINRFLCLPRRVVQFAMNKLVSAGLMYRARPRGIVTYSRAKVILRPVYTQYKVSDGNERRNRRRKFGGNCWC